MNLLVWLSVSPLLLLVLPTSLAENNDARRVLSLPASPASNSISRKGLASQLKGVYQERVEKMTEIEHRSLTSSSTVLLTITLDVSASKGPSDGKPNDGDFESWLCIMDSYWTTYLSDQLGVTAMYEGKHAQWAYNQGQQTATITIESSGTEMDLSSSQIYMIESGILRMEVSDSENPADLTRAVQDALCDENFFKEAVVSDIQAVHQDATTGGSTYFNTANCGVASITFKYGFFDGTDLSTIEESDIGNVLCATNEFYQTLFTQYNSLSSGAVGSGQNKGVWLTLDRVDWSLDTTNAELPLSVTTDAKAVQTPSHRQLSPLDVMNWMKDSDFAAYIKESLWHSVPEGTNLFYDVSSVKFNGEFRTSDAKARAESISTDWSVDSVMLEEEKTMVIQKATLLVRTMDHLVTTRRQQAKMTSEAVKSQSTHSLIGLKTARAESRPMTRLKGSFAKLSTTLPIDGRPQVRAACSQAY